MSSEREKLIEVVTSQQVVNAEFYNALNKQNKMLADMLMTKFKNYLNDDYFTDIERQTMLMQFFENQTDIDLIKEVLTHVQNCDLKDDYTKIIMEWTFHNSESIMESNLAKFDGVGLCGKKQRKHKLEKPKNLTETVMQGLLSLTAELIDPPNTEE